MKTLLAFSAVLLLAFDAFGATIQPPILSNDQTTNGTARAPGGLVEGNVEFWNATMKKWTNGTVAGSGIAVNSGGGTNNAFTNVTMYSGGAVAMLTLMGQGANNSGSVYLKVQGPGGVTFLINSNGLPVGDGSGLTNLNLSSSGTNNGVLSLGSSNGVGGVAMSPVDYSPVWVTNYVDSTNFQVGWQLFVKSSVTSSIGNIENHWTSGPPATASGSQTPWTTDISGGGFNLTNVTKLAIGNGAVAGPYGLQLVGGLLSSNATTGNYKTFTNGQETINLTNFVGASNVAGLVIRTKDPTSTNTVQGVALDLAGSTFLTGTGGSNQFQPAMRIYVVPTVGSSAQTMVVMSTTNYMLTNGAWQGVGPWTTNLTLSSASALASPSTISAVGNITSSGGAVVAANGANFGLQITGKAIVTGHGGDGFVDLTGFGTTSDAGIQMGGSGGSGAGAASNLLLYASSSSTANPLLRLRDGATNAWADIALGNVNASTNITLTNGVMIWATNQVTTPPTLSLGSFSFWNSNGLMLWKCWNTNGSTVCRPTTP